MTAKRFSDTQSQLTEEQISRLHLDDNSFVAPSQKIYVNRIGNATSLLTVKELADALKVPVNTVYYWTSKGDFPVLKIGRHLRFILEEVLEHFRERRTQNETSISLLSHTTSKKQTVGSRAVSRADLSD